MSVPSDGLDLEGIRAHVLDRAREMSGRGDCDGLLVLVGALLDELVRVSRVAEARVRTDLA